MTLKVDSRTRVRDDENLTGILEHQKLNPAGMDSSNCRVLSCTWGLRLLAGVLCYRNQTSFSHPAFCVMQKVAMVYEYMPKQT